MYSVSTMMGGRLRPPLVVVALTFAALAALSSRRRADNEIQLAAATPLELETRNEYGPQAGAAYPWLRNALLVEPSRLTVVRVKNPLEYGRVTFAVTGPRPSHAVAHNASGGPATTLVLDRVGTYDLAVTSARASRNSIVYCRYVRREIRSLTAEDRGAFLAAARQLWATPTAAGRDRYGPLYVGVDDLAEFHNTQAGAQDCDHIHDGLGFFTQHAALSMRFEQSVQLVDSRAALPYWDFTIEEAALRDASGDVAVADLLRTELWTDAYFGSAGLEGLAGAPVADGLWGYAAVRGGAWNTTHNAFGLLRAPWNNNPIPFVTRSATQCGADSSRSQRWPSCETHLASLRNTSTFAAWAYDAMLAPHGPLHVLVGGTTGCDAEYDALKHLGVSNRDVESLKMLSFALTKNLYRLGLRACPEKCVVKSGRRVLAAGDAAASDEASTSDGAAASADEASATPRRLDFLYKDASGRHDAASPCRCGCPALGAAVAAAGNGTALADAYLGYKVLPDPALRKTLREMAASADGLRRVASVVHVLCEADVLVGDQLESASPVDISFWPIHPTLERLYHWKVLHYGFDDRAFPDDETASVYGGACAGHRSFDEVHMDVDTLLSEGLEKTVTNAQLLEAFDPKSNALPFVYDAFRWDHCEARGVFLGRDR